MLDKQQENDYEAFGWETFRKNDCIMYVAMKKYVIKNSKLNFL